MKRHLKSIFNNLKDKVFLNISSRGLLFEQRTLEQFIADDDVDGFRLFLEKRKNNLDRWNINSSKDLLNEIKKHEKEEENKLTLLSYCVKYKAYNFAEYFLKNRPFSSVIEINKILKHSKFYYYKESNCSYRKNILVEAIENNDTILVDMLISHGANLNFYDDGVKRIMLLEVANNQNRKMVISLVKNGIKVYGFDDDKVFEEKIKSKLGAELFKEIYNIQAEKDLGIVKKSNKSKKVIM